MKRTFFLLPLAVILLGASCQKQQATTAPISDGSPSQAAGAPAPAFQTNTNGGATNANTAPQASSAGWEFDGQNWRALGTAPDCPDPLVFAPPVEVVKATSILYPGQTRGGNYKPHGGFRFDGVANDAVTIKVPMDGIVLNGARYIAEGELQYTFDMIAPCGIMFRVGHLAALSPAFAALVAQFPEAKENDSRTTFINPPVPVKAGDVIATAVGIAKDKNTFVDFGVYDLRAANAASRSAIWAEKHADDRMLSWHAVCWFDLLPAADAARVKSLPAADPTSGKTSDYCR